MKVLSCAATRRRLDAYHDEELPVSEQIAVASHLEWCDDCGAMFADMCVTGTLLRSASGLRETFSREEQASLRTAVVNQAKAEHMASFATEVREMFQDMHLVYAGAGAAAAAAVCVVVMLSMMRFVTTERPDSLAAIVNVLATRFVVSERPDSLAEIVDMLATPPPAIETDLPGQVKLPDGAAESLFASEEDDFALSGVVTRDGRVVNLELLQNASSSTDVHDAKRVEELLGAVARARFEPARVAGSPVSVNMVWLVTHTTVRANTDRVGLQVPSTAKKRRAQVVVQVSDLRPV